MNPTVLFVDDDPSILAGFQRTLRRTFEVLIAASGAEALAVLKTKSIPVIIADMHMPGMDGLSLLNKVKASHPQTVRIMLTGAHDQGTAIAAINGGEIFRFLNKPCQIETVTQVINDAIAQHRLITAERDLLEQTLHGAIRLLTDMLALVEPESFGRLERLRGDIRLLCTALQVERSWEVEAAAMLAHIGRTTLPPEVLQKADSGATLSSVEKDLLTQVPETGSMLLANIPRLEVVSGIVLYQNKRWDGGGFPFNSVSGTNIPLGARILAVIRALDQLERTGISRGKALGELARDVGAYDPDVLKAATSWLPGRKDGVALPLRHVTVAELRPGHVLRSDVITTEGLILIGIGQVITQPLIGRLSGFMRLGSIKELIIVEELPT